MPHVWHRIQEQAVTGVARTVHRSAHGAHPGIEQLAVIHEPLVAQRIELVDRNDMWRKDFQVGRVGMHRPRQRVGCIRTVGVVDLGQRRHVLDVQEVVVVFKQRRQLSDRFRVRIGDVTLGAYTGDGELVDSHEEQGGFDEDRLEKLRAALPASEVEKLERMRESK